MQDTEVKDGGQNAHQKAIVLKVRYIAAKKQFVDPKANPNDTLALVKPAVLEFFQLVEGNVNGGTKLYNFALDGILLTNLSASLLSLAENKHELTLDLIERFEQG